MAIAMTSPARSTWEDFRRRLIAEIAAWETGRAGGEWSYYECWLDALEALAVERGLLARGALDDRAEALAQRPAGHDHRHPPPRGRLSRQGLRRRRGVQVTA